MKLFTTPAIKRDDYAFTAGLLRQNSDGYSYRYWFCADTTRRIFGLPRNATKVWFEFYDRAGIDRWPVEVVDDSGPNDVLMNIDGTEQRISYYTARWLIRRLKRKKCYVACFYETPIIDQ